MERKDRVAEVGIEMDCGIKGLMGEIGGHKTRVRRKGRRDHK